MFCHPTSCSAIHPTLGGLYTLLKGATGLYKPVGGSGASFSINSNMLHIRDPFFKIKKYLQII